MTRPFLITGCGRSGTRYASDLLTAMGLPTGWERVLQPKHPTHKAVDYPWLLRRLRLVGDSNWLSVPYLRRLPERVPVCQTVRHPLLVIRSFLALRFFGDEYLGLPSPADPRHANWVWYHLPAIRTERTPMQRAMRYWLDWNLLCERLCQVRGLRCLRYQLEELTGNEAMEVARAVFRWIGANAPITIPEVKNRSITVYGRSLAWADLPDGRLKDEVIALAIRYGYGGP